ncbi:hypothetical protein [Nocardioides sp. L-11A]|uniref:hypothetical protein n=1 Tax=Nocardioides sp. L-11A TaxID=3043848 RepID=UPI00249A1BF6|nr:hypothetical protein QJ852_26045 [Nocardioides sp. L-11A]
MWQQYRAPDDEPPPDPGLSAPRAIRAGGSNPGTGPVVGIVAVVATVVIGALVASSVGAAQESDHADWYDCIAEERADGSGGLLSPADLCDIGHERPPGYVDEEDDEEVAPFGAPGFGGYGY